LPTGWLGLCLLVCVMNGAYTDADTERAGSFGGSCRRQGRSGSRRASRGFALLITLVLLAFTLLLLVALTALTQVETQLATNHQNLDRARQHALVGLNIAIGQLQKNLGPDTRVTAQGRALTPIAANPWFTGVWTTETTGLPALTWLISGNENRTGADLITPATDLTGPAWNTVTLVEALTAEDPTSRVRAPVVELKAENLPGFGPEPRAFGRYAYWIGDESVKAAVTSPDLTARITYAPYTTAESRRRLTQQTARDAAPAEFEPRAVANATRLDRIVSREQIALLTFDPAEAARAREITRARFHDWSAGNAAVLANTTTELDPTRNGLRLDLSQNPAALGQAFAAYANYTAYMETPGTTTEPALAAVPEITAESLRRRYRITPPTTAEQGWQHVVAPVLTSFVLQFNVRRSGTTSSSAALEVRARGITTLWNPFTSALVPESLVLEITGLPTVQLAANGGSVSLNLQSLYGGSGAMRVILNPLETNPASRGDPDDRSWLPGRLYAWRTGGGTVGAWQTDFYNRTITVANANVWTVAAGASYPPPASNAALLTLSGPSATLTLKLRRAADNALLATYTSPKFDAFTVPPQFSNSNNEYRLTYPFRLAESFDTLAADPGTWLTTAGRDPRSPTLGEGAIIAFSSGNNDPAASAYVGTFPITAPDRLLDRAMGPSTMSFNEDVPLFELPRLPLLSLGELQHLQVAGGRPFTVGNSWGAGEPNRVFDRTFFSGLVPAVAPDLAAGQPLPNSALRVLATKPDGSPLVFADLQAQATAGLSAKFLLQGAAFNVNSVSVPAWRAVLRGIRFTDAEPFTYAALTATKGSVTTDTATQPLTAPIAAFLRFPQSAQETYQASDPLGDITYAATNALPPADPTTPSYANTHLFRRGLRVLTAPELDALAVAVVDGVRRRLAQDGPFRTLESFLAPISGDVFKDRSVIERAIAEAKLNTLAEATPIEFSSRFLTQADILTALAPLLFVRGDTFLVRAYGEALNPATGLAAARTWCEARLQRLPAPHTPAILQQPIDDEYRRPPGALGRTFQLISFRWLSSSEI
jgi:hypothetical protein